MATISTNLELVCQQLKSGNVAAIPTETVYGLAGGIIFPEAIAKIYQLKQRPLNHPLIVHVSEEYNLRQLVAFIPDYAHRLIETFWPGPLTLVFQALPGVISPAITGGRDTVAIRCPAHGLTQYLLKQLPFPLAAPSANPFGKISPTTAQHVEDSFIAEKIVILDGGRCTGGIESTIVAAVDKKDYEILRAGLIDEEMIKQAIKQKPGFTKLDIPVPGQLAQHYQPEKPLYIARHRDELIQLLENKSGVPYLLSFVKESLFAKELGYQLPADPLSFAYELYYQLRLADKSKADYIAIELPPDEYAWQGVRERIMKAGKFIITDKL